MVDHERRLEVAEAAGAGHQWSGGSSIAGAGRRLAANSGSLEELEDEAILQQVGKVGGGGRRVRSIALENFC